MKILLIDNYDSFTFNLLQLFREAGADDIQVRRNDMIGLAETMVYDAFVISPGPGLPSDAGITCDLIQKYADSKRIFGVCLGMQAIAEVFGGKLFQPGEIMHGEMIRISPVHPVISLFSGLEQGFEAGLYHSWAVQKELLPEDINITAVDDRGVIMGVSSKTKDVCGVQFHPESIMTPMGKKIIENWLSG
jgi:anthranilate synthase component II